MAGEYHSRFGEFLSLNNNFYIDGKLRAFPFKIPFPKTNYERLTCPWHVSWVYEYDSRLFHFKGDGTYQFFACFNFGVFGQRGFVLLYL